MPSGASGLAPYLHLTMNETISVYSSVLSSGLGPYSNLTVNETISARRTFSLSSHPLLEKGYFTAPF
jgi:hypothetical protein